MTERHYTAVAMVTSQVLCTRILIAILICSEALMVEQESHRITHLHTHKYTHTHRTHLLWQIHKLSCMYCLCGEILAYMHPQMYTFHPHEEILIHLHRALISFVHIVLHIISPSTWANTACWVKWSAPPEVEQITVGDTLGYLQA